MNLSRLSISLGGNLLAAPQQWPVLSPLTFAPTLVVFRQVLYLRLSTGGADRIIVEVDDGLLQGSFQSFDYDACSPGEPTLAATKTALAAQTVLVALDAPRVVREVRLSPSPAPGSTLETYRVDGNTPADSPTTAAAVQAGVATLPSDPAAVFRDARFAVRLLSSGAHQSLPPSQVTSVNVRAYPSGPRLGIADPADLSAPLFFWRAAGEVGAATPGSQGEVDAGPALAAELQRYVVRTFARLREEAAAGGPPTLPNTIDVALVVESDAPCRFTLAALRVPYHFLSESFPNGEDKQVLRFPGRDGSSREASFQLPGNAAVKVASMKVVESFPPERPAMSAAATQTQAEPAGTAGLYVGPQGWAAQLIAPAVATSVSGVSLGVLPIEQGAELQVELQDDWEGQPSGKTLAGGAIPLGQAGRWQWGALQFSTPVVLPARSHWLLAKATKGAAVWLATGADASVRAFETGMADGANGLRALAGTDALYRFYSRSKQAQTEPPAGYNLAGHPLVEAQAAAETQTPAGTRVLDLTAALSAHLAGAPKGSPTTVRIGVASPLAGMVTVSPPRVEFDLPEQD